MTLRLSGMTATLRHETPVLTHNEKKAISLGEIAFLAFFII